MSYAKKSNKTKNSSSKTACKIVTFAVAIFVLFSTLFLLVAPMKASDVFSSLGMKNLSVTMAHSAAKSSDEFDDWWVVFERSVDAKNYQMVCVSSDKLQAHSDFSSSISNKTVVCP